MSSLRLILASLAYHWRMNLALACGVMAGTAVLAGALLVGDSMRGSLRHLTLDRLGPVDEALVTGQFFRANLADELNAKPEFRKYFATALPATVLQASVERDTSGTRANRVTLLGCDERFWTLWHGNRMKPPGPGEVVLNGPLAERLGAKVGDRLIVRLANMGTIPSESLLGRKRETVRGYPLSVGAIIPAEGPGRFSLQASQQLPLNAYVGLEFQNRLREPGKVNAILVAGKAIDQAPPPEAEAALARLLRPTAADYGIRVTRQPKLGFFNITTDRMLFDRPAEEAILRALGGVSASGTAGSATTPHPNPLPQGEREIGMPPGAAVQPAFTVQPALTYLANSIACGTREVPYSTITAVDFTADPPLGPFVDVDGKPAGPLGDGQIALNDWAARDLGAKTGDTVRVSYFDPESTHGESKERTESFNLAAIVRLAGPADDPSFTPEVPGVTDQRSINDWDPPFQPFHRERVRSPGPDEEYWDRYHATPKAFVSLATGRRLWASRFGQTTSFRVALGDGTAGQDSHLSWPTTDDGGEPSAQSLLAQGEPGEETEFLARRLALDPAAMGFVFQPVKRQGLAASAGTTPFDALFLAFSFFIIAAAVMLVALLFRLNVDRRAEELGILLAVGLRPRQVRLVLLGEGIVVAGLASLAGVGLGVGYAALMLLGLRTWWLAAVVTPFLRLYVTPFSLLVGMVSGWIIALATIAWSVRRAGRVSPRRLLGGEADSGSTSMRASRDSHLATWLSLGLLVLAVVAGLLAMRLAEEYRALAFFGAGALVLAAALVFVRARLRRGAIGDAVTIGRGNLSRLGVRNAARSPSRSILSIGLVAATSFLIVAISAFRLDPAGDAPRLDSGNGGFALVAESDQPIFQDLNSPAGRADLGFPDDSDALLAGAKTFALRVKPGDDASCLNLYRPRQPRILGMPSSLIGRGGFAWASAAALRPEEKENPWLLLERELRADADGVPRVPVVLDKNTASYSLHLGGVGATYQISDGRGRPVRLEVVGLLSSSIFQGDLLIAEKAFLRLFPDVNGYRFFLLETSPGKAGAVASLLERALGDYGLATETTGQRLAGFFAVQNTYLSTFQSLGGLGLLLGTIGLAAVELRNVLERRRELALLRATGFRRSSLAWLVMLENGFLLVAGLGCGVAAALVALLPHLISGAATVPWSSLAATLLVILAFGLAAGLLAVRAVLTAPLLGALRGE